MSYKFRTGVLILSLATLFLFGIVQAANNQTNKALVTVEVKNGIGDTATNLSKVYVAMYNVSVVNNEWWGNKVQVKKIPAGEKTVVFPVQPGRIVDFKVFETFSDVQTNKKQQFYSPPFKNFTSDEDSGKLCYVNGVDFSEKLPDLPCVNELKLVYSGSSAKVEVSAPSNSAVGMYNVSVVNDEWLGELVQVKFIPEGKTKASFSVAPGQIVDFLASGNVASARKKMKHQFTVPPQKNFSGEDGIAQLCVIAGVDIAKKLELDDGTASCTNKIELSLP